MDARNVNIEYIKAFLQSGPVKQIIFMVGVAVSVALGIVLYMSIDEPIYKPLDYQVNSQNMSTIVDTLDKSNIKYKINDRDGIVYVAAKDAQLAKMKLAAAGIAKDDSINYSFLNDQNNFANSQFIENARYLRALESDLAKTINGIEGVMSARVHIAVPQNSVFADESEKTTASVVLNIAPGFSSDREKVAAIIQIVAGSVPGLDTKNVAITDQYGHALSLGMDQDSLYNAEQINYQNNLQSNYEKRIETMITPLLGENKISVRVYANIDFTQQEEAHEQYDPDKKVLRSEETDSENTDSSGASGVPGSLSNSPPSDSDADKSHASSSGGGSQGKNQSVKNYELSKTVNYKKSYAPKIQSLSVAVVVDNDMVTDPKTKQLVSKPLDQDKINKITQLVQATIGYDASRGDKVTVVNSVFTPIKHDLPVITIHFWDQAWFWDMFKKLTGLVLGFGFLFLLYRKLSGGIKLLSQPIAQKRLGSSSESAQIIHDMPTQDSAKAERISQLKHLAMNEPSRVASVIKNWVGKQ